MNMSLFGIMLKNCIGCTTRDIFFISDIISDQDSLSLPHRRARNSSSMTALQAAVPVSKARLNFTCSTFISVSDYTSVVMMTIIVFVLTIVMTMVTCVVMVVVVMVI